MALDPVTSVSDAVTEVATVAETLINRYLSTEDQNKYNDEIAEYNKIMATSPRNPDDLSAYIMRLYNSSGETRGSLGNEAVEIPICDLDFFIKRGNYANLLLKVIAAMQYKQNSTGNS